MIKPDFPLKMSGCMKIKLLLLVGGFLSAAAAHAEIYKHTDEYGRVTYSNIPTKGAKKLDLDPVTVVPATKPKRASSTSNPTPASFPRVDADTQKARDEMRQTILEDELAAELKLLSEAKQTLAAAEAARGDKDAAKLPAKYLERLQQLRDNLSLHVKNVQALKIEIANLKR